MSQLKRGERREERLLDRVITFEGGAGPGFDLTDGALIRLLQEGGEIAIGTRVRIAHYDDARSWFEVVTIVAVESRRPRPASTEAAPAVEAVA